MNGSGRITGIVGRLHWSYYHAAAINGYTVIRTKDQHWKLTATVIAADSFKLTQRPLVFIAPHAKGEWCWQLERIRFPGGHDRPPTQLPFTIAADLNPPDTRKGSVYVLSTGAA
jgi:hypothetical protein